MPGESGKEVYLMKSAKLKKVLLCFALVLVLGGGSIAYYNVAGRTDGALTDQAATRDAGVPADGIVYIEPVLQMPSQGQLIPRPQRKQPSIS